MKLEKSDIPLKNNQFGSIVFDGKGSPQRNPHHFRHSHKARVPLEDDLMMVDRRSPYGWSLTKKCEEDVTPIKHSKHSKPVIQ